MVCFGWLLIHHKVNSSTVFAKELPIIDWTSSTQAGAEMIAEVTDKYSVHCIEAFDQYEQVIRPREYKRRLRGAVVLVHFGLSNEDPYDAGCSSVLEIFSLRVLVPPA
jgi:hypothetical protein